MSQIDRLPAIPLIVNDPYFSIWMPGDALNAAAAVHWTGVPKQLRGALVVDGAEYCYLGKTSRRNMETVSLRVTPTRTESVLRGGGVELTVAFWSPALPSDLDALSTPVTFVDFSLRSADGKAHQTELRLFADETLCYDGQAAKPTAGDTYVREGLNIGYIGQVQQHVLGNCGDHVTIDWGYLYMASAQTVKLAGGLAMAASAAVSPEAPFACYALLGYDDIAAINYFGAPCRAWYQREGRTLVDALCDFSRRHDELLAACRAMDEEVLSEAREIGGEDYALIAAAAWRHTFAAHKLIATP